MDTDEAQSRIREPFRWKRGLLFAALVIVPVAIQQWPWEFVPLRWQYPREIRLGQRIVRTIDRFKTAKGRLPSMQELGSALPIDDWPCSTCYEPRGASYSLVVGAGWDYLIWYDPQTREFRRDP